MGLHFLGFFGQVTTDIIHTMRYVLAGERYIEPWLHPNHLGYL